MQSTDELTALHERISSWFEPAPDFVYDCTFDLTIATSSKGAWLLNGKAGRWHPLDWTHDEAANARLLEAMPNPHLWRNPDGTWTMEFMRDPITDYGDEFAIDADRKAAVVQAFVKWAGIE